MCGSRVLLRLEFWGFLWGYRIVHHLCNLVLLFWLLGVSIEGFRL